MSQNLVGQSIERYNILSQIGEGGMATVYKALDTRLNREVALKVIRTEKLTLETVGKTLKRFEREARALAKLNHPHIVPVMDFGEYEGRPFLVMPFISGGTLKERLGRSLPWGESARVLIPIARALHYAHQQGIVHRDVKPSNILLAPSGDLLLTDFGIAKLLADTEETSDLTGTGMGIGTPEYMSPEQFQGTGVDGRTDVYSLGVVFYEMVTGKKPYTAKTPAAIMVKQATEALPRPSTFVSGLPASVEKILLKALAKNPNERFMHMGEFLRALEAIANGREVPLSNSTTTMEDSQDTFATRHVVEPTYSTVDQMAGQRTVSESQPLPAPPRRTSGWIAWVMGGLGVCLFGVVALVIISIISSSGGNENSSYNEPYVYEPPASNTEVNPTIPPTNTEYVYIAPLDQPTYTALPIVAPPTSATQTNLSCPGVSWKPRVKVGDRVRICTILRLSLRNKPDGDKGIAMFPDYYLNILSGPRCGKDAWWWKVEVPLGTKYSQSDTTDYSNFNYTNRVYTGWVLEGIDRENLPENDGYFLCP